MPHRRPGDAAGASRALRQHAPNLRADAGQALDDALQVRGTFAAPHSAKCRLRAAAVPGGCPVRASSAPARGNRPSPPDPAPPPRPPLARDQTAVARCPARQGRFSLRIQPSTTLSSTPRDSANWITFRYMAAYPGFLSLLDVPLRIRFAWSSAPVNFLARRFQPLFLFARGDHAPARVASPAIPANAPAPVRCWRRRSPCPIGPGTRPCPS